MPNDLSVQALSAVAAPGKTSQEPPRGTGAASANAGTTHPVYTNPTLRLDPALGLVVIQFHDASGNVTTSYPSQRQLNAYRAHEQTLPDQSPLGAADEIAQSADPSGDKRSAIRKGPAQTSE
jgi:hypothetical protein